jgi:hypothetical protein
MELISTRQKRVLPTILLLLTGVAWTAQAAQVANEPPAQLVRKTVQNEINATNSNAKYMFRDRKRGPRGSQTKLMVETRDGVAGLVVAINGQPLNAEQRQAEYARVERFIQNPDELHNKQKREKEDADRVNRIMRALPDAFLYKYGGSVVGSNGIGKPGAPLVRLNFRPNPDYDPPSHVEQVLTGMEGYLLVDPKRDRIAKIDGTLQRDVGFGWGILGHLDRGGHFLVEQGDVGNDHWEITRMDLSFTGKILIFKSLNIQSEEVSSDFQPVPANLSFAQGIDLLKKQEPALAQNGSPNSLPEAK